MPNKARKALLLARIICKLFGHKWQPLSAHYAPPSDPRDVHPMAMWTRCRRCKCPNPHWPYKWYPDEEVGDA